MVPAGHDCATLNDGRLVSPRIASFRLATICSAGQQGFINHQTLPSNSQAGSREQNTPCCPTWAHAVVCAEKHYKLEGSWECDSIQSAVAATSLNFFRGRLHGPKARNGRESILNGPFPSCATCYPVQRSRGATTLQTARASHRGN